MRLHIPSLPWTQTDGSFATCAYTTKVINFCKMMHSLGHEVILYSGEHNTAPCTEHYPVIYDSEQEEWFGGPALEVVTDNDRVTWEPGHPGWELMNERTAEIAASYGDEHDILCVISGWCQQPIASRLPALTVAEWGIGYQGVVQRDRWHWCFESEAWRHYIYAKQGIVNGRFYDTMIPNSFDPSDFKFCAKKEDYLLFVGRVIQRKGLEVASEIAKRVGMKLVIAGPGGTGGKGLLDSPEITIRGPHIEYVGPVGKEERAALMSKASCLLAPTFYIEPFGGVAVEAMMCGTPVVATNWGAFTETVTPGFSGYRFQTLPEAVEAVRNAMALPTGRVRAYAERYSIWNVRHEYDRWLKNLHGLWSDGSGVGDWNGDGAA